MTRRILCLLLVMAMVLGMVPTTLAVETSNAVQTSDAELPTERACEHAYKYERCDDSYEATDTAGGYRHYKCSECGEEYAYYTDPMVYVDGFVKQNGEIVQVNEDNSGSVNPNLPLWEHIPDAEPHVFWSKKDLEWRVYIYGSHDTGNIICGQDQVVWSAPVYDLSDWRFDGQIYDVYEKQTTARLNALFAPDTDYDVETDTYYMMTFEVFDQEVLSRCETPDGRFDAENSFVYAFSAKTGWGPYVTTDPAIYIENGTIYVIASAAVRDLSSADYVAGLTSATGLQEKLDLIKNSGESGTCPQFALICQMKADPSEGVEELHYCSIDGKGFLPINEGVSLRYDEASGQYIMVYFGNKNGSGGGLNNGLAYVYTDDLMHGEWKMGDNTLGDNVIHDNNGVYLKNPATGEVEKSEQKTYSGGNNHGGLVRINGQWYIFGHVTDNTHRMNTIEKVELCYEDGKLTIPAVEMTSSGAGDSLDAYETWDAGIFCYAVPAVGEGYNSKNVPTIRSYEENTKSSHGNPGTYDMNLKHVSPVTNIKSGNAIGYKYLDFGTAAVKATLNVLVRQEEGYTDGTIEVYLDAPSAENGGKKVGSVTVSAAAIAAAENTETGTEGTVWSWLSAQMDETISGTHAVYFVFTAETASTTICQMDQFNFAKEALPTDRTCEHVYSYQLCDDSYEATNTEGGYRHYKCAQCGEEYAYFTDPMVYVDGFVKQNGEIVEVNENNYNATNPGMDLWEHVPDGEPHVFWSKADMEWRVYIYGSHETSMICGYNHVTWSAPVYDLSQWRYDGDIFRVEKVSSSTNPGGPGGGPGGGSSKYALLFAPDCAYDVQSDNYYLATFEVGNSRVGVYPSTAADGWFEPEDIVYTCSTSVCTDPAIYFEDGVMYVAGNIGKTALSESVQADIENDEYPVISGSTTFGVIYQMSKNADGTFEVADTSYCPTAYGTSYLPVMEGLSIRYMEEYGLYVMVYYNNGKVTRVDTGEVCQAHGLCYMYTDDLMNGVWYYGDNGLGDNVIHANGGQYVKNINTGKIELLPDGKTTLNGFNDHGGIANVNGSWYVFGHRQTNSGYRQSIGQKLTVSMNGTELKIGATEITSSLGDALDAYKTWNAGIACYLMDGVDGSSSGGFGGGGTVPYVTAYKGNHNTETEENIDFDVTHYAPVANIRSGAVVGYKYLDFDVVAETTTVNILVRQEEGYTDGSVDVYLDAPSVAKGGTKLGTVAITAAAIEAAENTETGTDGKVWSWLSADLALVAPGVHAVYFVFHGQTANTVICLLDQFSFSQAGMPTARACEHTYSYELCEDSHEATDTEGGYRHYKCSACGAEYAYHTDPMVYADGFVKQNGEIVEVNETNAGATNPYLPLWEHIADAEPHVFWSKEDMEWRLYVFGSHDTTGIICGNDYVTWSAPVYDLSDWRYEGETLRIKTSGSSGGGFFPGGNMGKLFAPDCCYDEYSDAFYMISYDNSAGMCNVYRATQPDANYGQLSDIVFKITLGNPNVEEGLYGGSDPAIFFENGVMYIACNGGAETASKQGDAYITEEVNEYKKGITTSGPGRISIAMLYKVEETDGAWGVTAHSYLPIAGSQYHFFPMEEATSLRKDAETGYYILVYNGGGGTRADGVKHKTTGMSYAYTTDLMGEWHYGENGFGDDVIQDNHGHYLRDANGEMQLTDLETMCANNDSNHGGVVKANGNWYVFGHINTSNGCRQGIAEKIELVYTEDGKLLIGATEETSSGMADNLDAYEIWDAGIACYRTPAKSVKATGYLGNHGAKEPVEIDFDVTHYAPMKGLVDGAVLGYKYLDFGSEAAKTGLNVLLRQEEGYTDGTIEVYLDAPTAEEGGTKIGTVTVSAAAIEAAEKTEVGTDGNVWSWLSAEMEQAVSGEHGVYFVFHAETEATTICLLDQFQFVETKHPLAITTQPTTFAGQVGDTASFTVAANRSDVTYQWMYSQNGGFNWIKSTMPGADTATLSVEFKAFRENQMYKVVVTDSEGNTVESIPVALTKAVSQVVILKNPVDQTGSIGSTATFSVKAEGEGLTYQWMYSRNGGSSWLKSTADGANTATLSIQVKAFRNGQMYKCIVTDANGVVVESASATMNMK